MKTSKKNIILVFIALTFNSILFPQERIKVINSYFHSFNNFNTNLVVSKLSTDLKDSIGKYFLISHQINPDIQFGDKLFFLKSLKDEYCKDHPMYKKNRIIIAMIDTLNSEFKIYFPTLSADISSVYFFVINDYIYILARKYFDDEQLFCGIYRIDVINNICKTLYFEKQDVGFFNHRKSENIVIKDNNKLKIFITTYSLEFNCSWLFLWWAPRGAPEKWGIDEDSRKDYSYTLDEDLNLISIEEIPILKE